MAWGKFAGGDQCYLRDEQYRDATRLAARANLHVRYRTATVPWFRWLAAQVAWPAGGDVLEVGCGPGWLWVQGGDLLPAALRLTLTDLSPGMVAEAVERVRAAGRYAAVEGRTADAQALPFTDARFDVVVADHMLYHVPDPARAVAELRRVLRPGGVLVAATNGPRALRELWEVTAEVFGGPAEHETVAAFGSMTGRPLLLDRFASVAWHQYEDSLRCTNPSDVLAYLT
ncbi:MAG TPA: methyltransferase domain-containing protein, partial [Acidimicrobiales bacterium]|nr:methyltransferase domain-containing protein [Acidimicrobiales bacterium]